MSKQKKNKKKSRRPLFRLSKSKFTTFLIVVCISVVVIYDFSQRSNEDPFDQIPSYRTKGVETGDLRIVKFLDFQCGECALASKLLNDTLQKYPTRIYIGIGYFPHDMLNSLDSAIFAECAGQQDQFWPFHDMLFKTQSQWKKEKNLKGYLLKKSEDLILDRDELEACVDEYNVRRAVLSNKTYGESRFVNATPTFFINGEIVVGYTALQKHMESYFSADPNEWRSRYE